MGPRPDDETLAASGRSRGHGLVVAQGPAEEQVVPARHVEGRHVEAGEALPRVGDGLPVVVVQRVLHPVGDVRPGGVRQGQRPGGGRDADPLQVGGERLHRLGQDILGRVLLLVVRKAGAHLLAGPLVGGALQEDAAAHGEIAVVGGGGDPGRHGGQVLGGGQGRRQLGRGQVRLAEGQDVSVAPRQGRQGLAGGDAVGGLIGVEAEAASGDVRAPAGLDDDREALLDRPVQAHPGLHAEDRRHEAGGGRIGAHGLGEHGPPLPEVGAAGEQDGMGVIVVRAHDVGAQDRAVRHGEGEDLVDGVRGRAVRNGQHEGRADGVGDGGSIGGGLGGLIGHRNRAPSGTCASRLPHGRDVAMRAARIRPV